MRCPACKGTRLERSRAGNRRGTCHCLQRLDDPELVSQLLTDPATVRAVQPLVEEQLETSLTEVPLTLYLDPAVDEVLVQLDLEQYRPPADAETGPTPESVAREAEFERYTYVRIDAALVLRALHHRTHLTTRKES